MKIKAFTLLTLSFFVVSSYAYDINEHFAEKNNELNLVKFKDSELKDNILYCEQIKPPVCNNKSCETEKTIQLNIFNSCTNTIDDKIALNTPPMGPIGFYPNSYVGYSVFLSQFKNLVLDNPAITEEQFAMYNSYFYDISSNYKTMDDKNIINSFNVAGKYLDNKKNVKKPIYKMAHQWAENVIDERKFIEKQFSAIRAALSSPPKLAVFKTLHTQLIPRLTSSDAFVTYKGSVFTDQECEVIFLNLRDSYLSELYKQTAFECKNN